MRLLRQILLGFCLLLANHAAFAQASLRAQEMAQCLQGEAVTWGDGRDRPARHSTMVFVYRHTGAPPWFSEALVLAAVSKAATAWSQCGVPSRVLTESILAKLMPGTVLVQWSDKDSRGNFGLADLTNSLLSLGPAAFELLHTRNPKHDATQTLQMVISHEMGHHFGLMAHSRRCVDVTSYYDNGKGDTCNVRNGAPRPAGIDYRALLPTACDLQRCAQANHTDILLAPH